jgi:hypothetical protein
MNLSAKLRERAEQGRPLRVGLIGAGKFGAMYLAQVPKTPGIHVAGVADLAPANARANFARVGWPPERYAAPSLDVALVCWADVRVDESNRAVHMHREMEQMFAAAPDMPLI